MSFCRKSYITIVQNNTGRNIPWKPTDTSRSIRYSQVHAFPIQLKDTKRVKKTRYFIACFSDSSEVCNHIRSCE